MEKYLQKPVTGPFAQENILNRVVLLADKGPVLADIGGQVVAYTANQIIEDRRETPGRYVLWVADDIMAGGWKTEEELTALLASKEHVLVNNGVWKQPDTKHFDSSAMMADTRSPEEKEKERARMKAEDLKEDRSANQAPIASGKIETKPNDPKAGQQANVHVLIGLAVCGLAVLLILWLRKQKH